MRLGAAVLATFVIVTHDPPDLRDVARRVVTYIITALVIATFYVAGFTASQTVFKALPNYSPLLVGAAIAILLALIFPPLLSVDSQQGESLVEDTGISSQQDPACL